MVEHQPAATQSSDEGDEMTKDEIISMALESGFCHDINNGIYLCAPMHIERFAALVAAAEREACADLCDELGDASNLASTGVASMKCAAAIRARSVL